MPAVNAVPSAAKCGLGEESGIIVWAVSFSKTHVRHHYCRGGVVSPFLVSFVDSRRSAVQD